MGLGSLKEKKKRHEEIIDCLRSESYWTGEELSNHLNISYRTLMRDLGELKESGIPISSERGRGGGISLTGRWGLQKLNLDNYEVIALLVSLSIVENLNSPILLENLTSIRKRISSAFPIEQQRLLNKVRKRILIGATASKNALKSYSSPKKQIIKELTEAFFNQKKLEISYLSLKKEMTKRVVEPQLLCLVYPIWYFFCWDDFRQDYRLFRIDRINTARRLNDSFKMRKEDAMIKKAYEIFETV